jgi:SOS-response transcriptional repressor LexA
MIQSLRGYRYWLLLQVVLLMLPGVACNTSTGLEIISHQLSVRQFTGDLNSTKSVAIVSGVARNSSKAPINGPIIAVIFYDAQKNITGTASTSRGFLEPAENWDFTVQLTSPDAWKVRSYEINGSNQ